MPSSPYLPRAPRKESRRKYSVFVFKRLVYPQEKITSIQTFRKPVMPLAFFSTKTSPTAILRIRKIREKYSSTCPSRRLFDCSETKRATEDRAAHLPRGPIRFLYRKIPPRFCLIRSFVFLSFTSLPQTWHIGRYGVTGCASRGMYSHCPTPLSPAEDSDANHA